MNVAPVWPTLSAAHWGHPRLAGACSSVVLFWRTGLFSLVRLPAPELVNAALFSPSSRCSSSLPSIDVRAPCLLGALHVRYHRFVLPPTSLPILFF